MYPKIVENKTLCFSKGTVPDLVKRKRLKEQNSGLWL